MSREIETQATVIKLGGQPAAARALFSALAREIAGLGPRVAVVHGGGKEVTDIARALGHSPRFEDGVRITSEAEMDSVEMVLAGLVNKRLVRWLCAEGVKAVGICGADARLVLGSVIRDRSGNASRTAVVEKVDPRIVLHLWSGGYVPVIAPPGSDEYCGPVNINADDVAMALARAIGAASMVFLSDVEGVQVDGAVVAALTRRECERLIAAGTISGGMIPKVRGSLSAVGGGVGQVVIGSYGGDGDLGRLIEGSRGTRIVEGS